MECHSIQFTTISINVERGIVKILFKYRYFQDLLIDIDIFKYDHIDIDIDIDIFQKCRYFDNRYVISIYRTGLLQLENLYIKETKSLSFASLKSAPLAIVFRIFPQTSQLALRLWSSPRIAGPWKVADINLRGNQRLPSLLPTLEKKSYSGQGGHRAQRLPTCLFVLLTPFDPGPEFCRLPRFCAE